MGNFLIFVKDDKKKAAFPFRSNEIELKSFWTC